eukprot:scaffold1307_cov200-Pinguiococcus_pyrenoidosus.AAC.10
MPVLYEPRPCITAAPAGTNTGAGCAAGAWWELSGLPDLLAVYSICGGVFHIPTGACRFVRGLAAPPLCWCPSSSDCALEAFCS